MVIFLILHPNLINFLYYFYCYPQILKQINNLDNLLKYNQETLRQF